MGWLGWSCGVSASAWISPFAPDIVAILSLNLIILPTPENADDILCADRRIVGSFPFLSLGVAHGGPAHTSAALSSNWAASRFANSPRNNTTVVVTATAITAQVKLVGDPKHGRILLVDVQETNGHTGNG